VIDVVRVRRLTKPVPRRRGSVSFARSQCQPGQLQSAIANANQNVGRATPDPGPSSPSNVARPSGFIRSVRGIDQIHDCRTKGLPVRVRDVASVSVGAAPRLGIVGPGRPSRTSWKHRADALRGQLAFRTIRGFTIGSITIPDRTSSAARHDIRTLYDRAEWSNYHPHRDGGPHHRHVLVSLVLWLVSWASCRGPAGRAHLPLALLSRSSAWSRPARSQPHSPRAQWTSASWVDSSVIMMESISATSRRKCGSVL